MVGVPGNRRASASRHARRPPPVTVMVSTLPRMLAGLKAPASAGSLVSGGYAMFFGGLLSLGARLGDRFGHRRTITASLAVFAAGALLGAVARARSCC